jgi:hypothetical protein
LPQKERGLSRPDAQIDSEVRSHFRFDADSGSERQQKAAAGVEKIGDGFSLWA